MSKKLTMIGIGITAVYLIAVGLLGWGEWDKFSGMEPNQVGDFLAGVVGPLALLWLILGYFQQGEELKQSTEALRLQAEELRNSVSQQRDLVEVSRKQVEAQTAALDYERELQRRAWSPVFELISHNSGSEFGGERSYQVILHNHGAEINRVSVVYEGGGHHRAQFPIGRLRSGEPATFDVRNATAPKEPALIQISYLDLGRQEGKQAYRMHFHNSRMSPTPTVSFEKVED